MNTISVEWLEEQEACSSKIEIFRKEWSDSVVLNRTNLIRASVLDLDLEWFVKHAFPSLEDTYYAQRQPLYDAYYAQHKPLYDAYLAQRKLLEDAYYAQCKPLWDVYGAQKANLIADLLGL